MKARRSWIPKTIHQRLILCFLGIMCAMFVVMQLFFSYYFEYSRKTLADKVDQTSLRLVERIQDEISALQIMQIDWLLDIEIIQSFSGWQTPDLYDIYDIYFELKRRSGLLRSNSHVGGIYFYIAASDYLLTVSNNQPEKWNEELRQVKSMLELYTPTINQPVIAHNGSLYVVNPFIQNRSAARSDYHVALIFSLAVDNWFGVYSSDCIAWLTNEADGQIFSGDSIEPEKLSALSEDIRNGKSSILYNGREYVADRRPIGYGTLHLHVLQEIDTVAIQTIQRNFYVVFFLSVVTLWLIFVLISRKMIQRPLKRLAGAFYEVECGNYSVTLGKDDSIEFQRINDSFNHMAETLRYLIKHKYESKMLADEAELKLLQSQINPHFLYNSFFMMNSLLQMEEYDHLEKLTDNLGRYFQYVFHNAEGLKTLEQEVEHAGAYANIQQMRFVNRIQIHIHEIPEDWKAELVPAMCIQPLIENAFQHGFGKTDRNGELIMSFKPLGDELLICVSNTGLSMTDEALEHIKYQLIRTDGEENKSALNNIHRRLKILYGDSHGLNLNNMNGNGFEVSFMISRKGEEHDHPCTGC